MWPFEENVSKIVNKIQFTNLVTFRSCIYLIVKEFQFDGF